jgi:hypothetical protein
MNELEKLGEKLTIEVVKTIIDAIAMWMDKKSIEDVQESVILASSLTGLIMAYNIMAKNMGFEDHGNDALHRLIFAERNRKKET